MTHTAEGGRLSRNEELAEYIAVPFRILPSRGMNLMKSLTWIVATGLSLLAWGIVISLGGRTSPEEALQVALPFGGIVAVAAILIIRHQLRYFGPRGRYWLDIEPQQVTFTTPAGSATYSWEDLTAFTVDEDLQQTMDEEKHVHQRWKVSVVARDTGPEARTLRIASDDFASRFPGGGRERAKRFCAILNDVRRWAREPSLRHETMPARALGGLVLKATRRYAASDG